MPQKICFTKGKKAAAQLAFVIRLNLCGNLWNVLDMRPPSVQTDIKFLYVFDFHITYMVSMNCII